METIPAKLIISKMKTCKIVPPKKNPKRGIPINEFIKKYMNKITIDVIIPKIVLIIVNFLYNFTLYLSHNNILIINIFKRIFKK